MKRTLFLIPIVILTLALAAQAQTVRITYAWDKSSDDTAGDVKYRLCYTEVAPTPGPPPATRTIIEAGAALEAIGIYPLVSKTYYVFATAFRNVLVDGQPTGPILESEMSNILRVQVQVPPGNPGNTRVRVTTIAKVDWPIKARWAVEAE